MGIRQEKFEELLLKKYSIFKHKKLTALEAEKSEYFDIISNVYRKLGGQLNRIPINYGSWDISTTKFIIELDEERHFNRYRLETLESEFYKKINNFSVDNYKKYCLSFENKCLSAAKWRGNWKNASTERMFLKSDENGILSDSGSSRWRQRAYYDFLKDVTSKIRNTPLIRISVYDKFHGETIEELLKQNNTIKLNLLIDNINPTGISLTSK